MANKKMNTSPFTCQKPQEYDEGCENVPPASLLGENGPTTQTPNQNIKGKPCMSDLPSALTPVLKNLNIRNKSISSSKGPTKSSAGVSALPFGDKDSCAWSVLNESLPEITLLDATCNSPLNMTNTQFNGETSTPVLSKELKKPLQVLDVYLNSKLSQMTPVPWLRDEILPEITLLDDTCDSFCEANMRNGNDNPLIDSNSTLTPEKTSLVLQWEGPTLETTHDSKQTWSLESGEMLSAKTAHLPISPSSLEKMSATFNCSLTHSLTAGIGESDGTVEDVKNVQLQVTQDISLSSTFDGSKSSSENSTEMIDRTQPFTIANPINITRDLSTSNASLRCEVSQSSGTNSNNGPSFGITTVKEQGTAVILNCTFTTVQDNAATHASILQNQTVDLSTSSSSPPMSENTNVSTKQISQESSPVINDNHSDSKTNESCGMQNQTFENNSLQKSSASTIVGQACSTSASLQNTFESKPNGTSPESSPITKDNRSDSKTSQSCGMQNQTFEKDSLQKSSGSTIVGQACSTSTSLQNTFESKPNGIITDKEITKMTNNSQDAQDRSSPSPVKNETSAEPNLPDMPGEKIQKMAVPDHKLAEPLESLFSANVAAAEESSSGEMKNSLNNGLALCESIVNLDTGSRRGSIFNLDSSLEFKSNPLVTSTPMSTNAPFMFTVDKEDKTTAAQKRLYGEGPSKPSAPVSSEVPSNIVSNRKTFLSQPSTKLHKNQLKPPSLLSKFKPASLLPKRPDLLNSGQPTTRQIEAPKTNLAQVIQQTREMPNSYNLRSTADAASALKLPVSGLRKAGCVPSGIQRAGQGLKPPNVKGSSTAHTGSDKSAGGTDPVVKTNSQAKKHPLPKTDALPAAKKKKTDNPLPSGKVEALASSSDTTSKAKSLKAPLLIHRTLPTKPLKHGPSTSSESTAACETNNNHRTLRPPANSLKAPTAKPQCHDCARCTSLEAQLQLKDEEIRILKQELLRK